MSATLGLHVLADTGAPEGRRNYTTLVILHGCSYDGDTFRRLLPYSARYNSRIILVNRRDYPGTTPYSSSERALLPSVHMEPRANEEQAKMASQMLEAFMKERARELYDFLQVLIRERGLPAIHAKATGRVVPVGWSLGSAWITSLLTHVASFPVGDVRVHDHVRRVLSSGIYSPETDPYNPLLDPTLPHDERMATFVEWISSYYSHGDTVDELERRRALRTPARTTIPPSDNGVPSAAPIDPAASGGSDWAVLYGCMTLGVFGSLRRRALLLPGNGQATTGDPVLGDGWRDVEVLVVWGDRSVWEAPYAAWALREELDRARKDGYLVRDVKIMRLKGANHFPQWDHPEETLRAFLANTKIQSQPLRAHL
ncbi:hypothetical protein BD413DRAFT_636601 [Trametes elegans]|nr:hypothetical protein BD413DRAFT_636601 [Trametes elegans]